MLHVQSYLKEFPHRGPETLKEELGIEYRRKDGKVIFNYSQFDSPKSHPIVKECRGLILYDNSWDICCHPFERFFNYGESGADVITDLSKALVLPKLDGTMCNLYWDRNDTRWHVSTRSMIDAEGPVGDENLNLGPFVDLFWEGANYTCLSSAINRNGLATDVTFTFELTSPLNRIVTRYDRTKVTLLTGRNIGTGREYSLAELNMIGKNLGVEVIKPVKFTDWEDLLKMQGLDDTDEGYVVLKESHEGSHKRVKVKNPAYLSIARLCEHPSEKHFMELIQRGSADEFLAYYPEYKDHIEKLQVGLKALSNRLKEDYLSIQHLKDRKAFAQQAVTKMFPGWMFQMYDGRVTTLSTDLLLLKANELLEMIHRVLNNG